MKSAGLFDFLLGKDVYEMENRIIKKYRKDSINREDENFVQSFEFPIFIVYGWFAGVIVLVIEILCKNYKFSEIKKFKRIFDKIFLQYVNDKPTI